MLSRDITGQTVISELFDYTSKTKTSINEVFDKTSDWTIIKNDDHTYAAVFNTDDGKEVEFEADRFEGPRAEWQVAFTVDKQVKVTNTGDQFKIFGTVVEIFVDFISTKKPADVMIMADKSGEDSRVKLYDRMIKTLDKKFSEYSVEKKSGDKSVMYILYRTDLEESTQLNELFDQPYRWRSQVWPGEYLAKFRTDNKQSVKLTANELPWKNSWDIDFTVDGKTSVTGKGDQYKIFATIVEILHDFVEKCKPDKFIFTAEKKGSNESRSKLYGRMVKKFAKNSGYESDQIDFGAFSAYSLTKKPTQNND